MLRKVSKNYFALDSAFFHLYTDGPLRGVPGIRIVRNSDTSEILGIDLHLTHLALLEIKGEDFTDFPLTQTELNFPFDLRTYQQEAVEFARTRKNAGLFHDLGLGKSAIALASIREFPAILVCPNSAIHVWEREARQAGIQTQILQGHKSSAKALNENIDLFIVTIGSAHRWLSLFRKYAMGPTVKTKIFDEAHALHIKESKMYQTFTSVGTEQTLILTATPMRNRLKSLHGLLGTLTFGAFGSRSEFRVRYCGASPGEYGLVDGLPTNTEELAQRLTEIVCTESWTNPDIQHLRPQLIRERIKADISIGDRRDLLHRAMATVYNQFTGMDGSGVSGTTLAFLTAQRVEIGKEKAKWLGESGLLDEFQEKHKRVIWWAYHKKGAQIIRDSLKRFGRPIDYITGDTSLVVRERVLKEWQDGDPTDPRNLVCTISSMNSAVNLITAEACVTAEQSWAPIELQQLEARHHRPGNKHKTVYAYYITIPNTIDDRISQVLCEKLQDHETILGESSQKEQMQTLIGQENWADESIWLTGLDTIGEGSTPTCRMKD